MDRPELPLWVRGRPPWEAATWEKLEQLNGRGLPEQTHAGGVWHNTVTDEVWKPLDGRPFANAECHTATTEDACLTALAGRPGFPTNWRIETVDVPWDARMMEPGKRFPPKMQRRWLVRPKSFIAGRDWEAGMISLDQALAVEQIVRGMNAAGWLLNDPLLVGLDPDYQIFVVDLSIAAYTTVQEPSRWGNNDLGRIEKWLTQMGFDHIVKLRNDGRKVVPDPLRMSLMIDEGTWPSREYKHVYASRSRPMSPTWAHKVRHAHFVHDNYGKTGVHTWVVAPEPLDDDVIYSYELAWAWSPLTYSAPLEPVYWWETTEEEACQQLTLL